MHAHRLRAGDRHRYVAAAEATEAACSTLVIDFSTTNIQLQSTKLGLHGSVRRRRGSEQRVLRIPYSVMDVESGSIRHLAEEWCRLE